MRPWPVTGPKGGNEAPQFNELYVRQGHCYWQEYRPPTSKPLHALTLPVTLSLFLSIVRSDSCGGSRRIHLSTIYWLISLFLSTHECGKISEYYILLFYVSQTQSAQT